ncbi:MAG TPA: right-handed parallel beta-helix repeat-containing protein [Iamia sp.]
MVKLTGAQTVAGIKTFSSPPVVPDGSWSIADTSGLQATLDSKASSTTGVSVASPGGVDDTAIINTARTAAGVGGTIVFASGTYVVDGLAASVTGQRWKIMPAATVKTKDGSNTPTIDVTADGVTIDGGGTIDGNRANQTDAATGQTSAVRIVSRSRVKVRDLTIRDSLSHGVYIDASSKVQIRNNEISGTGPAGNQKQVLVYDTTGSSFDIRISGNTVDSTSLANGCIAITTAVAGRTVRKLRITGNYCLVGDGGATPTLGIELYTAGTATISDAVVNDNVIEGPAGVIASDQIYGISIGGTTTSATTGVWNVSVTGNVVRNCPFASIEVVGNAVAVAGNTAIASGALSVNAIDMTGGQKGVTVTGNTLLDSVDVNYAIHLGGGTNGLFGVVVSGNTIRNAAATSVIFTNGTISGASITGNTVTNCDGVPLNLGGTFTDSVIEGNVFDLTGVGGTLDGILIGSTAVARVGINNNTIRGASRNGIYGLVATSDISIVGNRITTCANGLKADAAQTRWTVVGNTISNNVDRGLIFSVASTNLAIASNTIHTNPGGNYYTVGSTFLSHVASGDLYRGDGSTKILGARGAAVADATGGTVTDVQARAAINDLLARLRAATGHGLIS